MQNKEHKLNSVAFTEENGLIEFAARMYKAERGKPLEFIEVKQSRNIHELIRYKIESIFFWMRPAFVEGDRVVVLPADLDSLIDAFEQLDS